MRDRQHTNAFTERLLGICITEIENVTELLSNRTMPQPSWGHGRPSHAGPDFCLFLSQKH
jgi:hypothetical protein